MVDFKEFEALLKEVVGGKRLSASKMTKLQEMAMKSLKHDTKLVSILYRTHKSLPNNQKVSSLYVFDALARAARHQANKHSLPVKETSSDKPGNAGTFLFKLEGILDGLIEDMTVIGTPEAVEKTRKVLEIWTKANTFPADVLSRLLQSVNQGGQGPTGETTSASEKEKEKEKEADTPASVEGEQTAVLNNLPPAILALLGSAIAGNGENTNGSVTSTLPSAATTSSVQSPSVEQNPLALLQQFTQKNQLQNVPLSTPINSANSFLNQPSGTSVTTPVDFSYPAGPMYMPPTSGARRYPEEREDPRRVAHVSKRYDSPPGSSATRPPRDRYDRTYDDSYSDDRKRQRRDIGSVSRWDKPLPPRRDQGGSGNIHSRSRSPPARSDPRDPRVSSPRSRAQSISTFTSTAETLSSVGAPSSMSARLDQAESYTSQTEGVGLDSFDVTGFDMTSADSWMSLGKAFKISYGRDGTQEELVSTFMAMSSGLPLPFSREPIVAPIAPIVQPDNSWQNNQPNQTAHQQQTAYPAYLPPAQQIITWETREQDELKRGGRQVGHGSYDGGGTGHAVQTGRWQQSDAIVLCGSDD